MLPAPDVEKPKRKPRKKRKKGDLLPNTRTFRECERRGWGVDLVETQIPGTFWKKDYINCIDVIAFDPSIGILGIQATGRDGGNSSARKMKIEASKAAMNWLRSGGRIEVWAWGERGARGEAKVWSLRRERAFLVGERMGWEIVEDDNAQ